ncbi:MAG TPA: MarR family transcriptional regulator [Burkholderiales bacterium]|nr:MarR family transcriptional regulator [Burkholderiales bacterium]
MGAATRKRPGKRAPAPLTKAQYEALALFRYRLRSFLRISEEICRSRGVTPLQYQLLLQVKGFPGRQWASVGELAERLQAKHHGMVSLVSRCERAGLVARRTGRGDQRVVEVELTPKGERCLRELALLHRAEHLSLQGSGLSLPDRSALRGAAGRRRRR